MHSHSHLKQKKNLCPSLHIFSTLFKIVGLCSFLWIWTLTAVLHAQPLKESFSSSSLPNWYRGNTSTPLPAQLNSWQWNPTTAVVGDANNTTSAYQHYEYAYVGLSPYDYDGATLSKWLISPMMYGLKNGDKIRFITKALAGRANRLEVRLNTHFNTIPSDSIYLGSGASSNDVGHFDNLLLTINPSQTVNGYPSTWTTYDVIITGLPTNEVLNGRVAFRYYITNAGYNNSQPSLQLPAPISAIREAASYFPTLWDAIEGLETAEELYANSSVYQTGVNGTYVAIDDVEQISTPGVFMNESVLGSDPAYVWHANNIGSAKTLNMGYKGAPGCAGTVGYPSQRGFYVRNTTDAPITILPRTDNSPGTSQKVLYLEDSLAFTLQPNESQYITLRCRSYVPAGTYYNKFWLQNVSTISNLGEVLVTCKVEAAAPPIASCRPYAPYQITSSGIEIVETQFLNTGSINSCGGTNNLSFRFDRAKGDTFTCADLGLHNLNLIITDNATKSASTCPVQVNISLQSIPVIPSGHTQTYYLRNASDTALPLSALTKPTVSVPCDITPYVTAIYYYSTNYQIPNQNAIPIGKYTVNWTTAAGGYQTSTLEVIDTIRPIARCKDTAYIGYTYTLGGYTGLYKSAIWGKEDIDNGSFDNSRVGAGPGSLKYSLRTSTGTEDLDEIPFTCANAGLVTPVTLKVMDMSGNYSTCQSIIKIANPDIAQCKNVSIDLDPTTGTRIIQASDLLLSGGASICGITNTSVSKYSFDCSNVNTTLPVVVSYKTSNNVTRSCTSQVTVKEYSESRSCTDTIKLEIPPYNMEAYEIFEPMLNSYCSNNNLSTSLSGFGANNFNIQYTGSTVKSLRPGITYVTRTSQYANQTYQCNQVVWVSDTSAPLLVKQVSNQNIRWSALPVNGCTYTHNITNPFSVGTYYKWKYTLSGATTKSVTIDINDYEYYNSYWLDQPEEFNPGITTITLTAYDYANNEKTVSYTFDFYVQDMPTPAVVSDEFTAKNRWNGNFCGSELGIKIASPVKASCGQKGYMWWYQVRDGYRGNLLYEMDSIPQDSGAIIPVKISPYLNQYYSREIDFGYHDKNDGTIRPYIAQYVGVIDSINLITCPSNTTVQNTDNTTNTFNYTLSSPISNLCPGSFWGYSVSGATTKSSVANPSVVYNSNQVQALSHEGFPERYPILAYNQDSVIGLNTGVNTIKLVVLEESGNVYNVCSYTVTIQDISVPQMTCPVNDTLHRSAASCQVSAVQPYQTVTGFTGPYGLTSFGLRGGNDKITLDKSSMPQAITFISANTHSTNIQDGYVVIETNSSGVVSFNWEYQSASLYSLRPFIVKNNYNPNAYSQPAISGITNSTAVQTGTWSQTVSAGDKIYIGLTEGGFGGYFKISNFSAPYALPVVQLHQPTYPQNPALYFRSDLENNYGIGNHTINYSLINTNNGNMATCSQQLTVIDDYGSSLYCGNTTIYLDKTGTAVLRPEMVVSSCFPISSTFLSKSTFDCTNKGLNNVSITSINQDGDTLTCNFIVTVLDTLKPAVSVGKIIVETSYNDGVLTDEMIRGLLSENCGLAGVSASQTVFSCNMVGNHYVAITATDSSGNTYSGNIVVEVRPYLFSQNSPEVPEVICQGDSVQFCAEIGSNFGTYYQWQVKDKDVNQQSWNMVNITPRQGDIRFFRPLTNQPNPATYMVTTSGSEVSFRKLNPVTQNWDPVFTPVTIFGPQNPENCKLDAFDDGTPYIVYLAPPYGTVKAMKWLSYPHQEGWYPMDTTMYWTDNIDHNRLFAGDGYFFPVKWHGMVRTLNEVNSLSNVWDYWQLSAGSSNSANTYVTNAKNIVGIRGNYGYNKFFRLNPNAGGAIMSSDSLTTDPTGNSSLFVMKSFLNEAYIAYTSATGKVCVKKFDGTANWTNVGAADFSSLPVTMLDFNVINGALYVGYKETSNNLVIKKYVNGDWLELASPHDNLTLEVNFVRLYDIGGELAVHISEPSSYNGWPFQLIQADGWRNAAPISNWNACFIPNTQEASVNQYRCIIGNACSNVLSRTRQLEVKKIPTLSVSDQTVMYGNAQTITAVVDTGEVHWIYGNTGATFTTPTLLTDEVYSVYAQNGPCYSDTLQVAVFANDTVLRNYTAKVDTDTLCSDESAEIWPDTIISGFTYYLYESGQDGQYTQIDGPYYPEYNRNISFSVGPTQTTKYKIRVEENTLNAAMPSGWGNNQGEHFDFDVSTFPVTNEITIEAWVFVYPGTSPSYALGLSKANNWEWSYGHFIVYNENTTRELAFPTIPGTYSGDYEWIHVATTAGPDGLKIYYDGVLVASNSQTATSPINNGNSKLQFGLDAWGTRARYAGFDEFRVWSNEHSIAEINAGMNTCLSGTETGLWLYHDFNKYDLTSSTFTAVKGNNCVVRDYAEEIIPRTVRENAPCMDQVISKTFSDPITIVVPQNAPYFTTYPEDYWGPSDSLCGGEMVKLVAHANTGGVTWYNSFENGSVLGTGDTLNIFINRDSVLWVKTSLSGCRRNPVGVDIWPTPEVKLIEIWPSNTFCQGTAFEDINFNVELNEGSYNYEFYDAPVGGNSINPYGDEDHPGMILYEDDTLWVEAYNDYCRATTRTPLILKVEKTPSFTIHQDTARYGPGLVTLRSEAPGFTIQWYDPEVGDFIDTGSALTVYIDRTKSYYAVVFTECGGSVDTVPFVATVLDFPSHTDTVLACGPYTWMDGHTYASDTNIIYYKQNPSGPDSAFYLNLHIARFEENIVVANRYSICGGDSVTITIQSAQEGYDYVLVDNATQTVLGGPLKGDGSDIQFNTGVLNVSKAFKVMVSDTMQVETKTMVCSKQLGDVIAINVGQIFGPAITAATCASYWWNGKTYTQSGVYYDTLAAVAGCDSLIQLNLTLFPVPEKIDTVSACQSYTWRGTTYTSSTRVSNVVGTTRYGCDSLTTLLLTIKEGSHTTDIQTHWDSYTWINGITYTSSTNTATHTLTNAAGCDSVITLNLTILNATARTVLNPQAICEGGAYLFNGHSYTTSNTYRDTLYLGTGNDTIVVTQLTVNPKVSVTDTVTACGAYTWHGVTYTQSTNTPTWVGTTQYGCDSTAVLHLTINSNRNINTHVAWDSYTWIDGVTYTNSTNTATHTLTNAAGCDSVITLNLTILNATDRTVLNPQTICDGSSYLFNGHSYTTSNTYRDTLYQGTGNDTIVVTQLTVNPNVSVTDTITACNAYTWHGVTYTQSTNTPTWLGTTQYGCDSLVTLNLTIKQSTTATDIQTHWNSYTWLNGVTYNNSTNTATHTLTNAAGCDSVITLNLTILNATDRTVLNPQTICDGSSYLFNGHSYTTSNTYRDTLYQGTGNDTIVVTQLTVNPNVSVTDTVTACNAYTWHGVTYTQSTNTPTWLGTTQYGCDSIVTLNLTIKQSTTSTDIQTHWNSYTWLNGVTYNNSTNTATHTLTNAVGCDSVITLNLTILNATDRTVLNLQTICDGSSYLFNGHTYTTSNTYRDTLYQGTGNDTIVVTQLTVNPTYTALNPQTICNGTVYPINGHYYSTSGTYHDTLHSVTGCDSIIVTQLTVNPTYAINNPQTICNGTEYTINGHNYSTSGTYHDTLHSVTGCDSIIVTQLSVNPTYTVNNPQTICNGQTYALNSHVYSITGTYHDTLHSVTGCDSVIVTQLTVNPQVSVTDTVTACNAYTWHGVTYTQSTNTPTWIGTTQYGCDSIVTLNLTIKQSTTSTDIQTHWNSYTWIDGVTYNSSANTATHTLTNAVGCDSVITLNLTILNATDRTVLNPQTICEGGAYLFNGHSYTTSNTYRDTLYQGTGNDTIVVTQLTVNPKPTTSTISGEANPTLGSTEAYSVLSTTGSTYNWIITNGTQMSGNNTNSITVLWSNLLGYSTVKVIETSALGCKGDTIFQNIALPVNLLSFAAQKEPKKVVLNWSTSSEQNNKGFDIERSVDAHNFEAIGFVYGKGTTTQTSYYNFNDTTYNRAGKNGSMAPTVYYRLKQVDFNGAFEYSQVVAIHNQSSNTQSIDLMAVPNPFQTGFDLSINSKQETDAIIEVFDAYGKQVTTKQIHLATGDTFLNIEHANEWKAGMYFIVLTVDNERQTIRLVKEQ